MIFKLRFRLWIFLHWKSEARKSDKLWLSRWKRKKSDSQPRLCFQRFVIQSCRLGVIPWNHIWWTFCRAPLIRWRCVRVQRRQIVAKTWTGNWKRRRSDNHLTLQDDELTPRRTTHIFNISFLSNQPLPIANPFMFYQRIIVQLKNRSKFFLIV